VSPKLYYTTSTETLEVHPPLALFRRCL